MGPLARTVNESAVEVEEVFSSAQVFGGEGRDNRAQARQSIPFTRNHLS